MWNETRVHFTFNHGFSNCLCLDFSPFHQNQHRFGQYLLFTKYIMLAFQITFLYQTPSLLAWVRTTLRTGMKAEISLKLLVLTMCVWMLSPSV